MTSNPWWIAILGGGLLVLAAVLAYHTSFGGVFVFDDYSWIVKNRSIQRLWPLGPVLFPAEAELIGGRPLVSLTLAVNYALSGPDVWSYHATNLLIHILAGLTLFGLVRRTLVSPSLAGRFAAAATPLAMTAALLWTLHPLQTQAVTYVIQRCESLMGLLYLLTIYCVLRGATSKNYRRWYAAAVTACLLGMATKEVMATAPLMVLVYDRTFLSGSFSKALQARSRLYLALAATWAVVAALLASTGFHGGSTGVGVRDFDGWSYLLTEQGVLVHYLRLAFWPWPLCLDYGWPPVASPVAALPPLALMVGLLTATGWALWKHPAIGFLGAWFFVILSPSSSFVPIQDAAFEHRMYLSLAAVVIGVTLAGYCGGQWLVRRGMVSLSSARMIAALLVAVTCLQLATLTFLRNRDYRNEIVIWRDTVAKAPGNARAHHGLAAALAREGRVDEAIAEYRAALAIRADYADAYYSLGSLLAEHGHDDEAIDLYRKSLEIRPDYVEAYYNLGNALAARGASGEAIAAYQEAVTLRPNFSAAWNNLGAALVKVGQFDQALDAYRRASEVHTDADGEAEAQLGQGVALAGLGRWDEAVGHFRKVLETRPDHPHARLNLGAALAARGSVDEAITEFQKVVQELPASPEARYKLALALRQQGRFSAAVAEFRQALALDPENVLTQCQLARLLATCSESTLRNGAEAVEIARRAVQLTGGSDAMVLDTLAAAQAESKQFAQAITTARQALQLAEERNNPVLAAAIRSRIELYRASTAYHEAARP